MVKTLSRLSLSLWTFITLMAAPLAWADSAGGPSSRGGGEPFLGLSLLIGIPHPLDLSLDLRVSDHFDVALAGGTLKAPFTFNTSAGPASGNAGFNNIEARGRWRPWGGAFFLGGILGNQTYFGSVSQTYTVSGIPVPTTVRASVHSLYFTPHLGWLWNFSTGFTLGFEFGVQVPINPASSFDATINDPAENAALDLLKQTPNYQADAANIQSKLDQFASKTLPYITVLRLGWSF